MAIETCNSKVIAIQLVEYHTKPERLSQKSGAISLEILYFKSARDSKPYSTVRVSGKSGRNWGDSTLFEDAVANAAWHIRHLKAE